MTGTPAGARDRPLTLAGPAGDGGAQLRAATTAVYLAFVSSGFAFATWAARIPNVKAQLQLSPRQLGLLLLALPIGSIVSLLAAGPVVTSISPRRAVAAAGLTSAAGLCLAGIGAQGDFSVTATGLALLGLSTGVWDVAMNVEAAAVEQRSGRSMMSRFHASLSAGTVLGAGVAAACAALHVPVVAHLAVVAVLVAVAVPVSTRRYLATGTEPSTPRSARDAVRAWTEPRTLALGIFVLSMAFSEGTGNDWLASAMIEGHHTSVAAGALSFAMFVAAMTLGRWFGPPLVNRYGPRLVTRASAVLAMSGLAVTIFGPHQAVALLGVITWGLGTAMGFPLGISAAADDPGRAAVRVSVVSSIGYTAFLAGPPLLGFLANHVGILRSLSITLGVVTVGLLFTASFAANGSQRPSGGVRRRAKDQDARRAPHAGPSRFG
ncbi:MFS transporter [Micromonospora yasonensis]|uniref:MFS transporter n=1 Tax=Micromonospora yasonensis TaxID=1128667 RepID=UPI0022321D1B|nr:MFS transporter [Micromonospora yasonensis]MCW3845490.1 MFS transporter [Micromonospora yasonensis]